MKHSIPIALLAAAMLGGCAYHHDHHQGLRGATGLVLHLSPIVTVRGDIISVGPEPLAFLRADGPVTITWKLQDGFRFADNGIVIEGPVGPVGKPPTQGSATLRATAGAQQDQIKCGTKGGGQTFSCTNANSVYGAFKYTIRVVRESDGKPLQSDPSIMNIE